MEQLQKNVVSLLVARCSQRHIFELIATCHMTCQAFDIQQFSNFKQVRHRSHILIDCSKQFDNHCDQSECL